MIEIGLLGGFSILLDGQTIPGMSAPRMQALLAYLLLHRGIPQPRQQVAFLLWPDSTEGQARTNLRKLLHQLRQALPEAERFLQIVGQEIQWNKAAPMVLDVEEFENAIQPAAQGQADEQEQLTRAVRLYRGDLLPGCYDEWLETERDRLRRQFANTLERLVGVLEWKRDYLAAIASAERLLQLDDLNEVTYHHLMRLHALAGDRTGALRVYQTCSAVLKKELSTEPGVETRDLYGRLMNNELFTTLSSSGSQVPREKPLIGRENEWMAMQQAWSRADKGYPRCVILSGEAGIGKTRLADEMLRWVESQGYLCASARCFSSEGALAYAPIADWLRSAALRKRWISLEPVWLGELARVLPEILSERPNLPRPGKLSADWQRRRLFEALVRALNPVSSNTSSIPIALLVDDLQWCDSETLAWLHYLLRSALPVKLLLIGTMRSEELAPGHGLESWMDDLRSSGRLDEVDLRPFSAEETRALAENEAGRALEPDAAARLYAETEGHPLFVVESMRMAGDPGRSPEDWPSTWEPDRSPTIQAVIARRLALLSPAARDLAGLAATVGRSFTYPVLAIASREIDEATLVRGLDELWQRKIIREHGASAYDFSHDNIRTAAYQGLSTARRRYLHRCVAESLEALAQAGRESDLGIEFEVLSGQIGSHFEKAGLPTRAVPYFQQAAEVAQRVFANERALRDFHISPGIAA